MSSKEVLTLLVGQVLEDETVLTLAELSRASQLSAERLEELVDFGVVEPLETDAGSWRFAGASLHRVRCAQRLKQDLGVNTAGAALALDLLEEIQTLRNRLQRLDNSEFQSAQ